MNSEQARNSGTVLVIALDQGCLMQRKSVDDPWAIYDAKSEFSRFLSTEEAELVAAATAASQPLSAVAAGRVVTYVPRRRKKGIIQIQAWGPADMPIPDHTRIISDVVMYAPRIEDKREFIPVDTAQFRDALAVYAMNHGQAGEGAARFEVVEEVLDWAAGAIHTPLIKNPGELASEAEAFNLACPRVYTDAERELLWKGWQLRFGAIIPREEEAA